jgi:hypothetical protein
MIMNMREFAGDMYLKVDDLRRSGPKKVTIRSIEDGSFGKPVLKFNDGTLLSVNATNTKALIRAYGEESDDWQGKVIELYIGPTQFNGVPQDSVLVRPISPAIPISERTPPKPAAAVSREDRAREIDDEIPF